MSKKKTVVIGASPEPQRYSHRAVLSLLKAGHEVVPVGLQSGRIDDLEIHTDFVAVEDVHTATLYVHPKHQEYWKDYIVSLSPKRVVFNPGAENDDLKDYLLDKGISCQESCTLVMLAVGTY